MRGGGHGAEIVQGDRRVILGQPSLDRAYQIGQLDEGHDRTALFQGFAELFDLFRDLVGLEAPLLGMDVLGRLRWQQQDGALRIDLRPSAERR